MRWGRWGPHPCSHLPEGAIQVGTVDKTELGVGPVKLLLVQVDGQPVGPVNVRVHNDLPGAAVHPRPLDSGRLAPVCPVHVPKEEGRGDSATTSALFLFSVSTNANRKQRSDPTLISQPSEMTSV